VHNTIETQSGSLKLRGLLRTARRLLRERRLRKALNSAQIAFDFASRQGEAPEIAASAQLLMAEILILTAVYTQDEELRTKGWRLLEQLETDQARSKQIAPERITYIKAICLRRLDNLEEAHGLLSSLTNDLEPQSALHTRSLVALAATRAQLSGVNDGTSARLAEEALEYVDEIERAQLAAELSLSRAYSSLKSNELVNAIGEAHSALRYAAQSGHAEVEALAQLFLGKASRLRGNHHIALRLLYEALDAADGMRFRKLYVESHLQIGHVFVALTNDREADKYFGLALDEASNFTWPSIRYNASHALGCSAVRDGRLDEGNTYLAKALEAANELGWQSEQAGVLAELAALNFEEGHHALAAHFCEESESRCIQSRAGKAFAKTQIVRVRLALIGGGSDQLLEQAEVAVAAARSECNPELLVEALQLLSQLQFDAKDAASAFETEREAAQHALEFARLQRSRHLPGLDMRAALRQKDLEIERLTQQNDLQLAIVAKNDEIERANQDLLQANEELRQFAYVASHDLKEPLRQIGSYVSLIKRNYVDLLDERGVSFFGFVTEGVGRLNRLLDSLMHYTSVARLDNEESKVDLNRLMVSIEQELQSTVRESKAEINYGKLPTVQSGGKLLRHVMFSLIDNALKFRRANSAPKVNVTADEHEGMYRIGIRDNGIGIKPEYSEKVFVLFQMLHAKTDYPGTGVGLAIAQKTIQRLGGRIWFEANEAGAPGVTFYFTVPMHMARELPAGAGATISEEAA